MGAILGAKIHELSDGNFAITGVDMTKELDGSLADVDGGARGEHERIVVIPREILLRAAPDIPEDDTQPQPPSHSEGNA